jgi:hypothetical protein
MIALLLTLMLLFLLYRTGTIKGRMQVALAFVVALVLAPFLLQFIILHFGPIGLWSVFGVVGLLAMLASYRHTARKNDAAN